MHTPASASFIIWSRLHMMKYIASMQMRIGLCEVGVPDSVSPRTSLPQTRIMNIGNMLITGKMCLLLNTINYESKKDSKVVRIMS